MLATEGFARVAPLCLLLACGGPDVDTPRATPVGQAPATAVTPQTEPAPAPAAALQLHALRLDALDSGPTIRAKLTRRIAGTQSPRLSAVSRCRVGGHVLRHEWDARPGRGTDLATLDVSETTRVELDGPPRFAVTPASCDIRVFGREKGDADGGMAVDAEFCWRSDQARATEGHCPPDPSPPPAPWVESEALQLVVHAFEDLGNGIRVTGFVNASFDRSSLQVGGDEVDAVVELRASCQAGPARWVEYRDVDVPTVASYKPGDSLAFEVEMFTDRGPEAPVGECRFEVTVPGQQRPLSFCLADSGASGQCPTTPVERTDATPASVEVGGLDVKTSRRSSTEFALWIKASAPLHETTRFDSRVECPDQEPIESTRASKKSGRKQIGHGDRRLDAGEATWIVFRNRWKGGSACQFVVEARPGGYAPTETTDLATFCFNNAGAVPGSCDGATLPEPKPEPEPGPSRRSFAAIEGSEEAIDCVDDEHCTITRSFVTELLGNPAGLSRQARVVPSVREGVTRGFKLYGIRPGSVPKLLKFKNGDMITKVNGEPLATVDAALGLFSKLRGRSRVTIEIERKGVTTVKEIRVR